MPITTLMPLPKQQFLANSGAPLAGGKVYTYDAGTSKPRETFTDAAGTKPQKNPIPLNLRGEADSPIYWSGNYRVEVRDKRGVSVYVVDNFNTDPGGVGNAVADIKTDLASNAGSLRVGFVQAGAGAVSRTLQSKVRELVSVLDFGADPTGVANSTAAFRAALTAVSVAGGGQVNVPPGRYRLTERITVPSFVLLKGMDWLPDPSNGAHVFHTTLVIDWGAGMDEHAVEMSHSSGIEGFTFFYPGQVAKTATTPVEFGFSISTPTAVSIYDNIHVKNITLYNSYRGIRLNNGGRWRVEDIQGDPLSMGITADQCLDVCYLDGVHFWNFYTQSDVLENWVASNGTSFEFRRIDQLFASKTFSWNRNIAYHFRDGLWGDFSELCCDKASYPIIIELAAEVRVNGFKLIGNASARPAIWGRFVSRSASFSNGRISEAAAGIGAQIDDGRRYTFDNVEFDNGHASVINLSPTAEVRISDTCRWNVPPLGGYKTWVDSAMLPTPSTPIPLPEVELSGGATSIFGGIQFNLSESGYSQAAWDTTYISQRNSLYVLEFDYSLVGASTTFYFKFKVSNDAGGDKQVAFEPLAPFRLNEGSVLMRVRIPFFINHGRFKQIMAIYVEPTIAVPGAAIKLTNITLSEQSNQLTTDAQVANMIYNRYNLDAYGMGQTLYAKGKNRIVITQPEAGIGRTTEVPTHGAWNQGDEILTYSPAAGGYEKQVCVVSGTPGTWKGVGLIAS